MKTKHPEDTTLDPLDAVALSEDGDPTGDAAVRGTASMMVTILMAVAAVAVIVGVVAMWVGRGRRHRSTQATLLHLPQQGLDAVRRGVEHLADMAS